MPHALFSNASRSSPQAYVIRGRNHQHQIQGKTVVTIPLTHPLGRGVGGGLVTHVSGIHYNDANKMRWQDGESSAMLEMNRVDG